ncbi:MAG: (2Fe-2S) ferredoxin domain-containing protein [Bacteroidetes bacterium]|nr:(2Fe-2S) ferredoxin domain-containing protein [Bacteroidota bacterium]
MIYDIHIFVCTNERSSGAISCGEDHGLSLVAEFKKQIKTINANLKLRTNKCGCLGICDYGPTIAIYPEGTFYVGVKLNDVKEIIESHLIKNIKVERLLLKQIKK